MEKRSEVVTKFGSCRYLTNDTACGYGCLEQTKCIGHTVKNTGSHVP